MQFGARRREAPEINLIPFIDVLLVVLIFLMLTTTYNKFTELQVNLPEADAQEQRNRPGEIIISVAADGRYAINQAALPEGASVPDLAQALGAAAARADGGADNAVLIISADALTPHQAVISIMEAARQAGLAHMTFAAQKANR